MPTGRLTGEVEIQLKPHHTVADTPFIVQLSVTCTDRTMGVYMSVATHDTALGKRKGGKGRRKGLASLKALRRALARRRLEEMREEEVLKAQIFDVLADE
jgi:hypothetical protein